MAFSLLVSTTLPDQGVGAVEAYNSDSQQLIGQIPLSGLPSGVALGPGGLLVGNQADGDFSLITQIGQQTGTFADPPLGVSDITVDQQGNVFAVSNNRFVQKFDASTGTFVNVFPVGGLAGGIANAVTTGPDGFLYVSTGRGNVEQVDPNTLRITQTVLIGLGNLAGVRDLAFNSQGALFLLDGADNTIKQQTAQGVVTILSGFRLPSSLAFGPNGNLFVADAGFGGVFEISETTSQVVNFYQTQGIPRYITFIPEQPVASQALSEPSLLAQSGVLGTVDSLLGTAADLVDSLTGVELFDSLLGELDLGESNLSGELDDLLVGGLAQAQEALESIQTAGDSLSTDVLAIIESLPFSTDLLDEISQVVGDFRDRQSLLSSTNLRQGISLLNSSDNSLITENLAGQGELLPLIINA